MTQRILSIRNAIAAGTYETPAKLEIAAERLLADIEAAPVEATPDELREAYEPERWDGQS